MKGEDGPPLLEYSRVHEKCRIYLGIGPGSAGGRGVCLAIERKSPCELSIVSDRRIIVGMRLTT